MPRVVHFEIPALNPERSVEFYSRVFGWKIEKWAGPVDYWLITTGPDEQPGINGAIKHEAGQAMKTINTIDVSSIDEFMVKVTENGGKVLYPKMAIPGIGYHTYCQDTEGVVFGLMESDSAAK